MLAHQQQTYRKNDVWQVAFLSNDLQPFNSLNVANYVLDQVWAVLFYLNNGRGDSTCAAAGQSL